MGKVLVFHSVGFVAGSPIGGIYMLYYMLMRYKIEQFFFKNRRYVLHYGTSQ